MSEYRQSKIPSVSTILRPFTDFSGIPERVLRNAAERGTRVHAACHAHAMGVWVFKLQSGDQPFFDSFRRWVDRVSPRFVLMEQELEDPTLGYRGHPDLFCYINGDDRMLAGDYKTPLVFQNKWAAQVAAYANLGRVNGYPIERGFVLRLRKTGKEAVLDEVDIDGHPWSAFINALGAFLFFKKWDARSKQWKNKC